MLTEVLILALLGSLGVLAYREIRAGRRWDAEFWRTGVVILRKAVPVGQRPPELPEPQIPPSWFGWRPKVHRVAPLEIAFTAQSSNSPLMKGLLSFDDTADAVVVTGRVFWGTMPLFISMGVISLYFEPSVGVWLCLAVTGLFGADYLLERRRFLKALASVILQLPRVRP
jgi:hypothetical protein